MHEKGKECSQLLEGCFTRVPFRSTNALYDLHVNFADGDAETRRVSLTTADEDSRDYQLVKRFPGPVQEVRELQLSPPPGLSTLPRGTGRECRTHRGAPTLETGGERTHTTGTVNKVKDSSSAV